MKSYAYRDLSEAERAALCLRGGLADAEVTSTVAAVCESVRTRGDAAVREWASRFSPVVPDAFRVPERRLAESLAELDPTLRSALEAAAANIHRFHMAQHRDPESVETLPGVVCRREFRPIESVGLYVPAGGAPLPSTVLMLGIPARIAGCSRIALCSPPQADGEVDATVRAAAALIGIREVYRIGGAQAIAALAFGTKSVPRVLKIAGPGNRYVTAAKRHVAFASGGVAIDMLAGPTELLVAADASAEPRLVAFDLLSQAEHDPDSHVVLVTTSPELRRAVENVMAARLPTLARRAIIERALRGSFSVLCDSEDELLDFTNLYAPEHLILMTSDDEGLARRIRNAGSVFLGRHAPVTAGDYASGTNHTLPTSGTAAVQGGVTVDTFQKSMTLQHLTRDGLRRLLPVLSRLAEAEGLEAHRLAAEARFDA